MEVKDELMKQINPRTITLKKHVPSRFNPPKRFFDGVLKSSFDDEPPERLAIDRQEE